MTNGGLLWNAFVICEVFKTPLMGKHLAKGVSENRLKAG